MTILAARHCEAHPVEQQVKSKRPALKQSPDENEIRHRYQQCKKHISLNRRLPQRK
ncbi:MAG TPA: hypothetical protein VFT78_06975 [Hanamia sp.]|nr:hypothetical protein [Hanamia sp.]